MCLTALGSVTKVLADIVQKLQPMMPHPCRKGHVKDRNVFGFHGKGVTGCLASPFLKTSRIQFSLCSTAKASQHALHRLSSSRRCYSRQQSTSRSYCSCKRDFLVVSI